MNTKIQKAIQAVKDNKYAAVIALGATSLFAAGSVFADGSTPTADPNIATTATLVGGQFQANILSALTTILPYVLAVVGIFLAVRLGMRWMKKSAR
jgi:hypothetical protein